MEELTDRVIKIKNLGLSLGDDLKKDSTILDSANLKAGYLKAGIEQSTLQVGTIRKHSWLKLSKLALFALFVIALLIHYLRRLGFFSIVAGIFTCNLHITSRKPRSSNTKFDPASNTRRRTTAVAGLKSINYSCDSHLSRASRCSFKWLIVLFCMLNISLRLFDMKLTIR